MLSDRRKSHLSRVSWLIFKLFPGKGFALAKYSPVTLQSSPATTILNETPGDKCKDLDKSSFGYLKLKCLPRDAKFKLYLILELIVVASMITDLTCTWKNWKDTVQKIWPMGWLVYTKTKWTDCQLHYCKIDIFIHL